MNKLILKNNNKIKIIFYKVLKGFLKISEKECPSPLYAAVDCYDWNTKILITLEEEITSPY